MQSKLYLFVFLHGILRVFYTKKGVLPKIFLLISNTLNKLLIILLFVFGMGTSMVGYAQAGGKKSEKRAKRSGNKVLRQYKSKGHADEFAKGNSGRRGRFARLFSKKESSWHYKSSGSKRNAYRENQFLLTRSRTKGKNDNASQLDKQNSSRAKKRNHGTRSFKFKKYKSR